MNAEPCMECARKHLRAALAYASMDGDRPGVYAIDSTVAMTSAAWVLLGEAEAYPDHYDLAIGMLVAAEDNEAANGTGSGALIRQIRLGNPDRAGLMRGLEAGGFVDPMLGHAFEAKREGRIGVPELVNHRIIMDDFDRLVKETETSEPGKRKEGDEDMACAKKAAAKGGKTVAKKVAAKKVACKGGKCKK